MFTLERMNLEALILICMKVSSFQLREQERKALWVNYVRVLDTFLLFVLVLLVCYFYQLVVLGII